MHILLLGKVRSTMGALLLRNKAAPVPINTVFRDVYVFSYNTAFVQYF
jgi:hypothetical protein